MMEINTVIDPTKTSNKSFLSESQYISSLLDFIVDGVIVCDHHGKFIYYNSAAQAMIGADSFVNNYERWLRTYQVFRLDKITPVPKEELPFEKAIRGEEVDGMNVYVCRSGSVDGRILSMSTKILKKEHEAIHRSVLVFHDITEKILQGEVVREAQNQLLQKVFTIHEKNTALKEVLSQIEYEKKQVQKEIIINIEYLIMPILDKIKLKGGTKKYIRLIQETLKDLTSSFGVKISEEQIKLTAREIEICNIIKSGFSNKEIARLLHIAPQTVEKHRRHIRKKLGLANKRVNLTSYLKTI